MSDQLIATIVASLITSGVTFAIAWRITRPKTVAEIDQSNASVALSLIKPLKDSNAELQARVDVLEAGADGLKQEAIGLRGALAEWQRGAMQLYHQLLALRANPVWIPPDLEAANKEVG